MRSIYLMHSFGLKFIIYGVCTSCGSLLVLRMKSLSLHRFSFASRMRQNSVLAHAKDRCAIITGVARPSGIGRCLVHNFLNQGYKVVGADIKPLEDPDAEKDHSDRFHFVQADISDPNQAKLIVDEAVQRFGGKIHVLINNAAKVPFGKDEDKFKTFTETVATNLNGAYFMSEHALPYMVHGESSIIHISSTRALQSEPNTAAYSASKAGLLGLNHSQAITLAGQIRVNVVIPGWINTDPEGDSALQPEDHSWHPAGRVGLPKDVAELCLFLCDNERSGFISGQEFVVDGGVTKKMVYPE